MTGKGAILVGHCGEWLNFYGENDQTVNIVAWTWLIEPGALDRISEGFSHEHETGDKRP